MQVAATKCGQFAGEPAGLAKHPLADRQNQTVLFGQRNKACWRNRSVFKALPAQQRFESQYFTAAKRDLRLKMQRKFISLQRMAQAVCQEQFLISILQHRRFVEPPAVSPGGLGGVHGIVSVLEDFFGLVAVAGV